MPDLGLDLPEGTRLVSVAEQPELREPLGDHNVGRLHVRAGGRIVRPSPRSMTITGSVAEWERWTGMAFPETRDYILQGGCEPVHIDAEAGTGTYHDSNVWVLHSLHG